MDDIRDSYDGFVRSREEYRGQEEFSYLFDLATSSLKESISVSGYQFVHKKDQEYFEKQLRLLIEQLDGMYDFANGKMVES